jgi:hypothetical protein
MNTVLKTSPIACGIVSVVTATMLGCGVAVGSFAVVQTVLTDPGRAAEPTVLIVLLAASAWREKSCRQHHEEESLVDWEV